MAPVSVIGISASLFLSCNGKKVKADIILPGNPISELRDITCHVGSQSHSVSVICHPTQVNAPQLDLIVPLLLLLFPQVHVWSDLLRSGVEHRRASWQRLHQHLYIRRRGNPRLHRLHIHDELEADWSPMERNSLINGRRLFQLYLHSVDHFQLVRRYGS